MKPLPSDQPGQRPLSPSPLDWPSRAGVGRELAKEIRATVRRRHQARLFAGTMALLIGIFVWTGPDWLYPGHSPSDTADYRISTPKRQILSDGSVVELNDGAALVEAFTPELRRIVLTRGEAHFKVTKNPDRPFVVVAAGIEVRAVGTAFAVEYGAAAIDVVVTEGRVAVTPKAAAVTPAAIHATEPPPLTLLDAGRRAIVSTTADHAPTPVVTSLTGAELERRLKWRVPLLEFSDTPLVKVVQLFAEHGHVHLTLGPGLDNLRISGSLRANNVDALLQLLAADHAVLAEYRPADILLKRGT